MAKRWPLLDKRDNAAIYSKRMKLTILYVHVDCLFRGPEATFSQTTVIPPRSPSTLVMAGTQSAHWINTLHSLAPILTLPKSSLLFRIPLCGNTLPGKRGARTYPRERKRNTWSYIWEFLDHPAHHQCFAVSLGA